MSNLWRGLGETDGRDVNVGIEKYRRFEILVPPVEGEHMKRVTDSRFVVDTSWKVLFGCGTALLILIEGSAIYQLVFEPVDKMKTIGNMAFVAMPWIASTLGLFSIGNVSRRNDVEKPNLWLPRFCFGFLVCFSYVLLIEGGGTLVEWLK